MGDIRMYKKILVRKAVLIKVPDKSPHMQWVNNHSFELNGEQIQVPAHWRNGLKIQGWNIILNRHYYDIIPANLDGMIVARVEVVKKTTRDNQEFIMLDIHKCPPGTKPTHTIKFLPKKIGGKDGITIRGTDVKIYFLRHVPHVRSQETMETAVGIKQ